MAITDEQPDLSAWIERTTSGSIVRAERQGRWRVQWVVDVKTPAGTLPLVARMPRDPEFVRLSAFTSHYDTRREARILEALHDTPIPTPRCYGFHEPTETILIERIDGTGDFAALTDATDRRRVLDEYIEHLVAVHRLSPDTFRMAGVETTDVGPMGGQLRWMRQDYDRARPSMRPEPLLDFSLWWLDNHAPLDRTHRSVVQGDTGPGQFMFDDRGVIALIDWELADIDDPMLDLGVMRMRNVLYPMGSVDDALARYAHLSGEPLDLRAIRYFTVLASLVSPLGMAQSMQAPTARIDSMLPRLAWDASMRRCLCEALLEANGLQPDPPALPEPIATTRTPLHDFLVEHLDIGCAGLATDDYGRYLLGGGVGLAKALRLLDQVGPSIDAADLDDVAELLGARPPDRRDADARLAELVRTDPAGNLPALVRLWHRMAVRREFAWTPLMVAQGSAPLAPLPDDLGQAVTPRA